MNIQDCFQIFLWWVFYDEEEEEEENVNEDEDEADAKKEEEEFPDCFFF